MATNPFTKKSSIPRATHDCDRPDSSESVKSRSKLRGPKPPSTKPPPGVTHPYHSTLPCTEPPDGMLKEDEGAVRRSLMQLEADNVKMRQTLEDTVREAEERLATMSKLMAEREKMVAERESLSDQVGDYEKKLIENNIDPVTGEAQVPTEEQTAAVEKVKKLTKGDISKMRDKLHEMNNKSDQFLTDVQSVLRSIEELEGTSQRMSKCSEFQGLTAQQIKELIGEVDDAMRKEELQKKKAKKEKAGENEEEDEESDDEEEDEKEEESPREAEKVKKGADGKTLFVTQKTEHID